MSEYITIFKPGIKIFVSGNIDHISYAGITVRKDADQIITKVTKSFNPNWFHVGDNYSLPYSYIYPRNIVKVNGKKIYVPHGQHRWIFE